MTSSSTRSWTRAALLCGWLGFGVVLAVLVISRGSSDADANTGSGSESTTASADASTDDDQPTPSATTGGTNTTIEAQVELTPPPPTIEEPGPSSETFGLMIDAGTLHERLADGDPVPLPLGTSREDTLAVLLPHLGGPSDIITSAQCGSGVLDLYNWQGFTAMFSNGTGEFAGWRVGGAFGNTTIATAEGVGVGSTIADLAAVDPQANFELDSIGWEYFDGELSWLADADLDNSPIYDIFAGDACVAR